MESIQPNGRLRGRVALITGGSRGIGAAIARRFAAEGARVAVAARTRDEGDHPHSEGSVATSVASMRAAGAEAIGIVTDVSRFDECERAVEETAQALGPIDILVNNAALTSGQPIAGFDPERWQRIFAVNVHAAFYLSRLVLPAMLDRQAGAILNISSSASRGPGRGPYPADAQRGSVLYGTTKAALERFTQGLAAEVCDSGISVTALSPSAMVLTEGTRFHAKRLGDDYPTEPIEMMERAAVLLAATDPATVSGRVCYSQEILAEHGWLTREQAKGTGVDHPGSPHSAL